MPGEPIAEIPQEGRIGTGSNEAALRQGIGESTGQPSTQPPEVVSVTKSDGPPPQD